VNIVSLSGINMPTGIKLYVVGFFLWIWNSLQMYSNGTLHVVLYGTSVLYLQMTLVKNKILLLLCAYSVTSLFSQNITKCRETFRQRTGSCKNLTP
jgi:hypothetical protein